MTFTDWLLTCTGERSPRGDLTHDIGLDRTWPRSQDEDLTALLSYLDYHLAIEGAKRALVSAWCEWYLEYR